MQHKIELYDDGIGAVEYVSHMGDDLTVVNSARVSFGKSCSANSLIFCVPLVSSNSEVMDSTPAAERSAMVPSSTAKPTRTLPSAFLKRQSFI